MLDDLFDFTYLLIFFISCGIYCLSIGLLTDYGYPSGSINTINAVYIWPLRLILSIVLDLHYNDSKLDIIITSYCFYKFFELYK